MRHYMPGHSMGLLPYLIQGVFTLIFLALVVALVVIVAKKLRKGQLHMPTFVGMAPNPESDPYLSALKLLNERLANGDIDVDEYYARRTALKGPDPTVQS
ncbi:MAG TPA: hypothetical protein VFK68_04540 [Propionibacteriaceae bacterium]|nr:hypothetical protein [Propionibacteriaceae bacterium]